MTGSEFVRQFARSGLSSWEAAAIALAREDAEGKTGGQTGRAPNLTPWPWVDIRLSAPRPDGGVDTAVVPVMSDALAIGPFSDHVRLPLTPSSAQSIANLFGWLLPTPWLAYQMWRASPIKLAPIAMEPNKGADLYQYADHSALVDRAIDEKLAPGASQILTQPAAVRAPGAVSGIGKHVVVSNIYQPGKVVIFGWYRPSPPFPDVYDDGTDWRRASNTRQPIQPKSNAHGDFYVDYSHLIQPVWHTSIVNGQPMPTEDLYRHPTLSRLVSNESPSALRVVRYPAAIPPRVSRPASVAVYPASQSVVDRIVVTTPPAATAYFDIYRDRVRAGVYR
jgi:hypothetical protein